MYGRDGTHRRPDVLDDVVGPASSGPRSPERAQALDQEAHKGGRADVDGDTGVGVAAASAIESRELDFGRVRGAGQAAILGGNELPLALVVLLLRGRPRQGGRTRPFGRAPARASPATRIGERRALASAISARPL